MGILDGLSKFGIKNVSSEDMYREETGGTKLTAEGEAVEASPEDKERELIFAKTYECVVCDAKFKSMTLKSSKARLLHMDQDLRPVFEGIEPIKYEPVVCPNCGYSVMAKFMKPLTSVQRKSIIDNISQTFNKKEMKEDIVSYDDALERIQLCLASAIVRHAKASEKAYICLKGGWLCRSYLEYIEASGNPEFTPAFIEEIRNNEIEYMDNAYEGFVNARQSEDFPIAGMDENTLDLMLAVMAKDRGRYDVASKMIASVLQSGVASSKLKDRARDLKDEVVNLIKQKG